MKICQKGLHLYPDTDKCCKECKRIKNIAFMKQYRIDNADKRKASLSLWYQNNKQKQIDLNRQWRNKNRSNYNANARKTAPKRLDKLAAKNARRRANKLKATPKWLTKVQLLEIEAFYILAHELQWLSSEKLHVDHIVPLQGDNVSGLHVPWNLQILPASDNVAKGNKFANQS
jgi:hypothetical protein